jgi:hypothetical protein
MNVPTFVDRSNHPCDPAQALLEPPIQVASLISRGDQSLNVLRHSVNSQVVLDTLTAGYLHGLT